MKKEKNKKIKMKMSFEEIKTVFELIEDLFQEFEKPINTKFYLGWCELMKNHDFKTIRAVIAHIHKYERYFKLSSFEKHLELIERVKNG